MGESGSGKTSFLQAGVLPRLSTSESTHRAVYVKFADRHPIDTIRAALTEQLKLPKERVATADLLELLAVAEEAIAKPLILLFDQFEQFFVHYKHRSDRQPFIQALTDWHHAETLAVRILVCIRGDMCDRLVELHQALGYSLGPQEVFRLEKFTPTEAAKVLRVIADTEDLQFDDRFVAELAEQELANREDGLICPVDLQILAWMIQRQTTEELRAFNRTAFQKFGGVEGLMTRFLERTLEARMIKTQREAAVKVLLALTDLERNVRAGVLTLTELQTKLQNTVKPEEVEEAASWLARSDVRLITPIEHTTSISDTTGYELDHERIIPALMRLAGQELKAADRINQLLDRRVNEWLGNQRNSRYLLTWRELWLVRQQEPYLILGAQHRQTAQLLRQSYRQIYQVIMVVVLFALLTIGYGGWLFYIPQGQIQRVRWELARPLHRVEDSLVADAAIAFTKDGRWQYANSLVIEHISDSRAEAKFLSGAAEVHSNLGTVNIAQQLLSEALEIAQNIDDPSARSDMLIAIAEASGQLEDANAAQQLLSEVLQTARTLEDSLAKSDVLRAIAEASGQLEDANTAQQLLSEVLETAQNIDSPLDKSNVLSVIVEAFGQLEDTNSAQQLLSEVLQTARTLEDSLAKSDVLRAIAEVSWQLKDADAAQQVLQEALQIARTIDYPINESNTLSAIAQVLDQLKDTDAAQQVLQEALQIAQTIEDPSAKSNALNTIAQAAGQLEDPDAAQQVLQETLQTARTIDRYTKPDVLRAIAEAYGQLEDTDAAQQVLQEALQIARTIEDSSTHSSFKSDVLRAIAKAYGQLKDTDAAHQVLQEALQIARTIEDPSAKSNALNTIAQAAGQLEDPDAAQQVLQEVFEAAETVDDSHLLKSIAATYAKLKDWGGSLRALGRCRETEKVSALTEVLTLWAEKQNPALRELREEG
jgi:tetratricopeptide (TPR) repeat protein